MRTISCNAGRRSALDILEAMKTCACGYDLGRPSRRDFLAAGSGLLIGTRAIAADAPLVVGQSAPLTGDYAPATRELNAGLQLSLDRINAGGGIGGRRVELRSRDDGYVPQRTIENTRAFIESPDVVALAAYRGTPNIEACFDTLTAAGIALIGPQSGAASMYDPHHRLVFPARASYRAEVERIVSHASVIGFQRVGVLWVGSAFGADVRDAARASLKAHGMGLVVEASYPRTTADVQGAVTAIAGASPQTVIIAAAADGAEAFIKAMRQRLPSCTFYLVSNVSQANFSRNMAAGEGSMPMVCQVFPHPQSMLPLMQRFREDLAHARAPATVSSYAVIEGYVIGSLLARALAMAGPQPTREHVAHALAGRDIDIGGIAFSYPLAGYVGSRFTELTMVSRDGTFIH